MNISRVVATGPSEARNPLSAATDRVWVVARKDIRDLVSGKFYIYLIFICLICLPYFDSARNAVNELSKQGMSASDVRLAAQSFLDTMAYTLPVMLAMLLCSVFASYAILMDKTKRAFESLLATPLSLKQIWMGKTIGVALPGMAVGIVVSLAAMVAIDLAIIAPVAGSAVAPAALPIVSALVISPILVFLAVMLISLLQLIMTNPRIPSFAFTVIFMAIYATTVIMKVSSGWNFGLTYLMAAIVIGIALTFLSRFLTNERTVLSSKGQ